MKLLAGFKVGHAVGVGHGGCHVGDAEYVRPFAACQNVGPVLANKMILAVAADQPVIPAAPKMPVSRT